MERPPHDPGAGTGAAARPRVLFVGRTRYRLPLPDWLAKKWDALERQLEYRVVATAQTDDDAPGDVRFRLLRPLRPRLLDGVLFYLRAPFAVYREILDFRPEAIVAESPYTGAAALIGRALAAGRGRRPRVVVEVHGDWRTATRMYGSPKRRVLSPVADAVSRAVVRRGDAVRALSRFTESLVEEVRGVPVTASFPTYTDLGAFTGAPPRPLPARPTAIFIGMLEAYKNVDGLSAAWRRVAAQLPDAHLVVVGDGARRATIEALVAELPERVTWRPALAPDEVAGALDEATALVLPSFNEGLGRVVIEALARGRGVVASRGGGIPDIVRDGVEGLLVEQGDEDALVEALVRVLSDPGLAETLGAAARERYADWHTTPAEYAARVRSLVEASLRAAPDTTGRPRMLVVAGQSLEEAAVRALREELDVSLLVRDGNRLPFHPLVPLRVRIRAARFRPDVIVADGPHLGFLVLLGLALRRSRPSLVVETYGNWQLDVRLGGSRARHLVAPLADWAARYALRRADALRAVSPYTAALAERAAGVPTVDSFPGYIDLGAFTERPPAPLPQRPTALFVGMLERSKNVQLLARAWPGVLARVPDARLVVVGRGALVDVIERLRDDFPDGVEYVPELPPAGVAREMDRATLLVLPSRSEGLGRVILESYTRGRAVVATRVGGIPDLVRDGETGLLVDDGDLEGLAEAMARLLADRELAARLGAAARAAAGSLEWTPDDYAARLRTLVDRTLASAGR